jgi:DNA-binding LytR/AlgR family response regulator
MGLTAEQIELAKTALQQVGEDSQIALCVVKDFQELAQAAKTRAACVLVVDVNLCIGEQSDANALASIVGGGGGIQVVLVNVVDSMLPSISEINHAYLLPRAYDVKIFKRAVEKAFTLIDKRLDQPMLVHLRRRDLVLQPNKVVYIESDLRKIKFHMIDDIVETYGKLSELVGMLPCRFVQCHKSFVVNMSFVEELDKDSLLLSTGDCIPVSQKRRKMTREAIASYIGRVLQ